MPKLDWRQVVPVMITVTDPDVIDDIALSSDSVRQAQMLFSVVETQLRKKED